ncbi:MAG: VIT1/CCC1 transporter family protein [bacterium JZ-2024 1]
MDGKGYEQKWQDEGDSAYLYRVLAELEKDKKRREIYLKLATVEEKHQKEFEKMLDREGKAQKAFQPSVKARFLGWMAKKFGTGILLNFRIWDEGREFRQYLKESAKKESEEERRNLAVTAVEEKRHAETLQALLGSAGEPWHRMESGGILRNVVYGFNDGLTANFGLLMGVVGAKVSSPIVVISGLAGMISDALSMGSSGYLASLSEAEVYQHEIALEREEIALMPEIELEELALLYEAKGLPPDMAKEAATRVMKDPEQALKEKTALELGISGRRVKPLHEGLVTGIATGFGAFIPIFPFLFMPYEPAFWTSFVISMLSHFLVGAARSIFTGRGAFRSGLDMFLVGMGVAFVGYLFGFLLERVFRIILIS